MKNKFLLISVLVIIATALFFFLSHDSKKSGSVFTLVDSIKDIHGMVVDIANKDKLYIGTHHGLLLLENGSELYRVGKSETDFMGFNVHPKDPNVFYSSGHPQQGGNIGFQKSEDKGQSWNKISNGVNGPVDFHSIAISRVNPELIYGWHQTSLQRSIDGGHAWELINTKVPHALALYADTEDENILYAITIAGIFLSEDNGATWEQAFPEYSQSLATALTINPQNSKEILLFTRKEGLLATQDKGRSWEKMDEDFGGEIVIYFAQSPQDPNVVYAATHTYKIYRSNNNGHTWTNIH